MVGLCGVIGDPHHSLEAVAEGLVWTGEEYRSEYRSDSLQVTAIGHDAAVSDQPALTSTGDTLIWVWGELFGYDDGDGYRSREEIGPDRTDAEYCAELYRRDGIEFVEGLNGEFTGLIFDREANEVSLFTDRLGTRPVFYTRSAAGELVFCTNLQSITRYPAIEPSFSLDSLFEYFTYKTTFGLTTPVTGVEKVPPASIGTLTPGDPAPSFTTYWRPTYDPADLPFDAFVDRFVEVFLEVMEDRYSGDRDHGLLLSGGGDSRLVLAGLTALDKPVRTFHLNEWMNREARVAERLALTADVDFELLRRDSEYQVRALQHNPRINNFVSLFNQAHANGFADELCDAVDVLLTGGDGELFFRTYTVPERVVNIGVGKFEMPVMKRIRSLGDYLDHIERELPAYVSSPEPMRRVLERHIKADGAGYDHHGVRYDSLEDLIVCSRYYPYSNLKNHFNYGGLLYVRPNWTPFLDRRLIDLHLGYPIKYRLRRNIMSAAVERLNPELAAITYPNTGLPLNSRKSAHYLADLLNQARKKWAPRRTIKPHHSHGAWTDHAALLREADFFEEAIEAREPDIEALPFLKRDGMDTCFQEHRAGKNNTTVLYTLLTFLNMPVTDQIAARSMHGRSPRRHM